MSVYFLKSDDFEVKNGQFLYKNMQPEYTLILFYSNNCPHCKPIIPMFQQLALTLRGCKYGVINLKENSTVAHISRESSLPITYVPLVCLFYNGRVVDKFNSKYSVDALKQFIIQSVQVMTNKFQSNQAMKDKEVPAFTTGTPYCDEESGICYLSYDSAYSAKN